MKAFKVMTLAMVAFGSLATADASALVTFGLKGGLVYNMDKVDVSGVSFGVPSIGYTGGASVEFGMGPIGLLTDILYLKTATRVGTDNTYVERGTTNILVPVQAKFSMMGVLSLTAGGYWNYGLGKVNVRTVVSGDETTSDDISYDSAGAKKSSFGIVAGLGVGLPLGVTTLTTEARFRYGLTDLDETSASETKTMAIDLLVGFTF